MDAMEKDSTSDKRRSPKASPMKAHRTAAKARPGPNYDYINSAPDSAGLGKGEDDEDNLEMTKPTSYPEIDGFSLIKTEIRLLCFLDLVIISYFKINNIYFHKIKCLIFLQLCELFFRFITFS